MSRFYSRPSRRRTHNRGFTLVELLVVIAIIGVLVALLLPAVQAAREASRRIKCQNHLKQLALGVENYESSLKAFPASGIVDTTITTMYESRSGKMFSWIVLILPYIEQAPLHNEFDFGQTALNQTKEPQRNQPAVLLCPSDQAKARFYQDSTYTNKKIFGKGNYAAFVGPVHVEYQNRQTWKKYGIILIGVAITGFGIVCVAMDKMRAHEATTLRR